jgi:fatty-acyl-CoA synthase/long-chain acyl-CoA synthetase
VPRHIDFVDTLPMNATGKVLKYELRERANKSSS